MSRAGECTTSAKQGPANQPNAGLLATMITNITFIAAGDVHVHVTCVHVHVHVHVHVIGDVAPHFRDLTF